MYFEYPAGLNLAENLPTILAMAEKIKERNYSNPGFVCTGSSGAIIASIISIQFQPPVPVFYIRKDNEKGHYHEDTRNFFKNCKQLIVIDDLISTGATVGRITEYIKKRGIPYAQGICLVNDYGYPALLNDQTFFIDNLILKTGCN